MNHLKLKNDDLSVVALGTRRFLAAGASKPKRIRFSFGVGGLMEEEESKAKRTCRHHEQRPATEEDMISNLPDSLISQILFYLPTKEAVRTSVLSHSWLTIWLLISELDLDSSKFPTYDSFAHFVDRFLDNNNNSCLHKLTLKILKRKNDKPCLTRWIDFVSKRKLIKHLDVEYRYVSRKRLEVTPTLRLENNTYASATGPELLISSCPVLEDLSIIRRLDDNARVLRVRSQTITSLKVEFDRGGDHGFFYFDWESLALFVDAPRLEYLNLDNEMSPSKFISSLGSLVKVRFVGDVRITFSHDEGCLSKRQMVSNVFKSISTARDFFISELTMEIISCYFKAEQFPQFCNVSSLEAEVCLRRLDILGMLPTFLESFPNLNSIVLDLTHSKVDTLRIALSSVPPQCLLSSLESVEIKSRYEAEFVLMELARYFAENSVILKKLVVSWNRSKLEEDTVLRNLLALQWRSSICQIEVCGPLKRLVV